MSPTTLRPGEESFLTIFVSGLSTTDLITIRFSGPAGVFDLDPGYVDADQLISAVPIEAMFVEGRYSVDVYVTRGELTQRFGPGFFDVEIPQDEPPPFYVTVPDPFFVEATSLQGAVVTYTATANDGTAVTCTPPSGSTFPLGGTTVTCTATNSLGQTAANDFAVSVVDTVPPALTVPTSIVSEVPTVTWEVSAVDALDPNPQVSCSPASGSQFPGGVSQVKCFAVDHHQNYAFEFFSVHVLGGPPALTLPPDISVDAASAAGTVVDYTATASEGAVVTCTPPSGSTFPLGATTVNCSATNQNGTSSGTFSVVVHDFRAPTLFVPGNMTVPKTSPAGATVSFIATATDAVDPAVTVLCLPPSGSTFPVGTTEVQCFAIDDTGNMDFGGFLITVINTPPPVLTVPADFTVEATGPGGATVTFTATATNDGVVVCSPASGALFPLGTTTVSCTATNAGGSDTETFKVTVADTTAPVAVLVRPSASALWPPNHKMTPITLLVVAIDAVDLDPTATIINVTSNQPVDGTGDGDTAPDWEITGPLSVNLRSERAGNEDRVYTITIQLTDDSNNTSTATTVVRVSQSRRR